MAEFCHSITLLLETNKRKNTHKHTVLPPLAKASHGSCLPGREIEVCSLAGQIPVCIPAGPSCPRSARLLLLIQNHMALPCGRLAGVLLHPFNLCGHDPCWDATWTSGFSFPSGIVRRAMAAPHLCGSSSFTPFLTPSTKGLSALPCISCLSHVLFVSLADRAQGGRVRFRVRHAELVS